MLQTEIRKEYPQVIGEDSFLNELAAQAVEVLGYKELEKHVHARINLPLLAVLSNLGIEILNYNDVMKYQREHKKERAIEMFEVWKNQNEQTNFYMPTWVQTKIEDYKEAIPEFILNKAVQIKQALPEVIICIEHLSENPDPFLVVKTQTDKKYSWSESLYKEDVECYYIEVWNEPKFENRLR